MEQKAINDFESGELKYLMGFGLIDVSEDGIFQDSFINANYGVDLYWGGCVPRMKTCYESKMNCLIEETYGSD